MEKSQTSKMPDWAQPVQNHKFKIIQNLNCFTAFSLHLMRSVGKMEVGNGTSRPQKPGAAKAAPAAAANPAPRRPTRPAANAGKTAAFHSKS